MTSEIQACVEAIADRLGLPVSLTDADLDSLVFSPHPDELLDEVRRDSILLRSTAPWVKDWFAEYGVGKSSRPIRVEPHPAHSTLSRWIVPVRRQGIEHGFICVLDPERSCDDRSYQAISDLVDEVAELLYEAEAGRLVLARHVADALAGPPSARPPALEFIERAIGVEASRPVTVLTVTGIFGPCDRDSNVDPPARVPRPSGPVLQGTAADHHICVVPSRASTPSVVRRIVSVSQKCCGHPVVGISEERPLNDSSMSYDQARSAMSVAARLPDVPDVLGFDDLGALRFLAGRADAELLDCIDPRVRALVDSDDPDLLKTVERYLANGCDAAATVAELNIHRGTLYYRLKKVETLDLSSGADRLTLHISLLANELVRSPNRPRHPGPVRLLSL